MVLYSSFIVNRGLSFFMDTIFQVNEMNRNHHLDSRLQFDYLINTRDPEKLGLFDNTETDDGIHIDNVLSYENKYDSEAELLKAYVSYSYEVDDVNDEVEDEVKEGVVEDVN